MPRLLDRLALAGAITGYTIEPRPGYLVAGRPVLTYSTYEAGDASRVHMVRVVGELLDAGARVELQRRRGTVRLVGGLRRTRELTALAWLDSPARLRWLADRLAGLDLPGRWRYPDLRVCGVGRPRALIAAHAHTMALQGASAVVLSLSAGAPLPGMTTAGVALLPCWREFLGGTPAAPPGVPRRLPGSPVTGAGQRPRR